MDEYLDIRDWDGNLTGEKKERGTVHREGDIHGTSHIVVRQIKRRYIRHIKTRLIRGNC